MATSSWFGDSLLPETDRAAGVVAASAGNHAQGVAFAACALGAKATVVMPEGAPLPKVEATRSYGADVAFQSGPVDACLTAAVSLAKELGSVSSIRLTTRTSSRARARSVSRSSSSARRFAPSRCRSAAVD